MAFLTFDGAMPWRHSLVRRALHDAGSVLLLVGALWALKHSLHRYLEGLSSPLPLAASFLVMLAFTFRHEWKASGISRRTLAMFSVHVWLFVLAGLIAPYLRAGLIHVLHQLNQVPPEFVSFIGADYRAALGTAVIGYGGCFTVGVALGRLTAMRSVRALVYCVALRPGERSVSCPHCGHLV
jgi:hypothetical protein